MPHTVHAACSHDCPDSCGVLITVDDFGRASRIQGDPDHPVTRGFLCAKVSKYLERVYSPDRLLYPMKRVARKGGPADLQGYVRIDWDEALDTICRQFQKVAGEYGPEAILPYSYAGNMAVLSYGSMDRRFFHRLGASQLDRTICATAGGDALISVLGRKMGTAPESFTHAKLIIAWGANIHGNNVHLWPFIEEARHNGARLVVIDPYRTRTARCADWHIPINPGTDVALALGMMYVIFSERLENAGYIAQFTEGVDALRERAKEYPPHRVAEYTGIPAADIARLAREYAGIHPAVIRVNYGLQRCDNGGQAVRAICMLPCITGSWRELGGGLQLSTSGAFGLNTFALERPDLMLASPLARPSRIVNMAELGKALNDLSNPPVQALHVYNSNPAVVAPNSTSVLQGLSRPDLFTVVHDQFFTDTAEYADIVLPATTFFEHKDLQTAYGHYYLQLSRQAIEPLGEARSNMAVFAELAGRMGFQDPCFHDTPDQMIEQALESHDPWVNSIEKSQLERLGFVRLDFGIDGEDFLPFFNGFPTSSGKALLCNHDLRAVGADPLPGFATTVESRCSAMAERFPLELLARKADNFLNSSFCNLPTPRRLEKDYAGQLELHPLDAKFREIVDGAAVRVFNERGEVELVACIDENVQPGVVAARLNWAKLSLGGKGLNGLTPERLTDIGRGPTFYSCLVEVERL